MPSSVWTGYLTFGLISMPVRLFSGARGERIAFHMLHRDDQARIRQQLICSAEEKPVERSEIVKGFEYRKGEYVVIEPDEIRKIEPKTAKAMEILEFVKADEVDPVYFESSYYLMPEDAGKRPYALLAQALEETNFFAIAKLTMHNREYTVVVRPDQGGLMLHTMFYKNEIRRMKEFGRPDVEVKESEIKVAHQLIQALAADFKPEKYYDTFEENLKKLIQARLEGKEITPIPQPGKPAPVVDLMEALKQSLAQTRKGPQRVTDHARESQRESEVQVKGVRKRRPSKKAA